MLGMKSYYILFCLSLAILVDFGIAQKQSILFPGERIELQGEMALAKDVYRYELRHFKLDKAQNLMASDTIKMDLFRREYYTAVADSVISKQGWNIWAGRILEEPGSFVRLRNIGTDVTGFIYFRDGVQYVFERYRGDTIIVKDITFGGGAVKP
jgi:hypothetical protein